MSNKSVIGYSPAIALLAKNPVGVEKLFSQRSAEIGSRQDALGTIFSVRADIFYPQILDCFSPKESFSTDTPHYTNNRPSAFSCLSNQPTRTSVKNWISTAPSLSDSSSPFPI